MLSASPLTASRRRLPGSWVGSCPVILVSELFLTVRWVNQKTNSIQKGSQDLDQCVPKAIEVSWDVFSFSFLIIMLALLPALDSERWGGRQEAWGEKGGLTCNTNSCYNRTTYVECAATIRLSRNKIHHYTRQLSAFWCWLWWVLCSISLLLSGAVWVSNITRLR